jgi:alpha-beta hydrolase superfamily lysophospholipase
MPAQLQDAAVTTVLYLHGFASSAASTKAAYFKARFADHGIALRTPDFNQPDFSTLTVTRMVEQVLAEIEAFPPGPVVLIGSSMGAFVAVQAALKLEGRLKAAPTTSDAGGYVDRLILLAPALDFGRRRDIALGDRSHDEWKASGFTNVFHYGYGRVIPVHYELYADACGYECEKIDLDLPIQIFQGRNDTVVDPRAVEAWATRRPNVELHMLDDDHQLGGSLDYVWREVKRFLRLDGSTTNSRRHDDTTTQDQ